MKVGSLVVALPIRYEEFTPAYVKWQPISDEKTIYTVREIFIGEGGDKGAYLEEGIIGHFADRVEVGINISLLREVQPPMDVSMLLEETEFATA